MTDVDDRCGVCKGCDMDVPRWLSLDGHVAIVTGCGSETGIGFATATALAELGARVVVTATGTHIHDRVEQLTRNGHRAEGIVANLTKSEEASSVVNYAVETFGSPSILINNAGMTSSGVIAESGTITDITEDQWQAGLQRNLDTAFHISRFVIPYMRQNRFGRIVFVSSVTGALMAMRGEVTYSAAKAAMIGLMRSIAIDEAANGITANAVAPGWINTGAQTSAEKIEGELVPLGRSATTLEVASTITFLCTPGSAYTTGQVIAVDGGNSIGEERRV
jgi:3-oxoacyl-[acyl-carrier protein] reductase